MVTAHSNRLLRGPGEQGLGAGGGVLASPDLSPTSKSHAGAMHPPVIHQARRKPLHRISCELCKTWMRRKRGGLPAILERMGLAACDQLLLRTPCPAMHVTFQLFPQQKGGLVCHSVSPNIPSAAVDEARQVASLLDTVQ